MKIHSVKHTVRYFIVVIPPSDHPAKNIIILRQLSRRKTFSFATFALSSWRFLPIESFVTACDVNHNFFLCSLISLAVDVHGGESSVREQHQIIITRVLLSWKRRNAA